VSPQSVRTYGLTHIALAVGDVKPARKFYADVFGMLAVYEDPNFVQMQTPGSRDVLVLEKSTATTGKNAGVKHFGFRLIDPGDIGEAAKAIEASGGTITDKGEFIAGEPYIFFRDPDGYEVEVWYEIPTRSTRNLRAWSRGAASD
jgi:catechol 2,3-dioxygenase-like lactoylglutathione lyase family enzyme